MAAQTLALRASQINRISTAHGFWPTDRDDAIRAMDILHRGLTLVQEGAWDTVNNYLQAQSIRNMGEMLMLAVSELAEALEEDRDGRPLAEWRCKVCGRGTGSIDVKELPDECAGTCNHHRDLSGEEYCDAGNRVMKPEGLVVELVDAIIRELDTAFGACRVAGVSPELIDAVYDAKMNYNDSRPFKHGRAY
jgi:hypothetical protein